MPKGGKKYNSCVMCQLTKKAKSGLAHLCYPERLGLLVVECFTLQPDLNETEVPMAFGVFFTNADMVIISSIHLKENKTAKWKHLASNRTKTVKLNHKGIPFFNFRIREIMDYSFVFLN